MFLLSSYVWYAIVAVYSVTTIVCTPLCYISENVCCVVHILALCPALLQAFYVPGVAPTDFFKGDPVNIKVSRDTYAFLHSRMFNFFVILHR